MLYALPKGLRAGKNVKMNRIEIQNKTFDKFITRDEIRARIVGMRYELSKAFKGKKPIFVLPMNGSFKLTNDLVAGCKFDYDLITVDLSSFSDEESREQFEKNLSIEKDEIKGRNIIIIKDIIGTGKTLSRFIQFIQNEYETTSISVVVLLLKPTLLDFGIPMNYIGFRIPDYFVVGNGFDYDGEGAKLDDIYYLVEEK